ncbi:hypothetical protein CK203_041968 [Vitis vinifera]|uniref:UBN2 domain-containing protein n=1 Tax=Vitis vinifera TaxID=29760 RepID=A0A438I0C0_VITVI|nr:hypothetical protein CK203_041968 [Vitis vinifera]
MKDNETIVEMITRFTDIVNGLEALGKTYKESENVMKILRSLPSKWHTKINLAKKQQESEDKKKKSIALKVTTKEEEEVEEEKQSEENENLALITRKFNKFMRGERFRGKSEAKRRKKKTMMTTWSESEDESYEEEKEKEVANMCFMAIDELDKFNNLKKNLEK